MRRGSQREPLRVNFEESFNYGESGIDAEGLAVCTRGPGGPLYVRRSSFIPLLYRHAGD